MANNPLMQNPSNPRLGSIGRAVTKSEDSAGFTGEALAYDPVMGVPQGVVKKAPAPQKPSISAVPPPGQEKPYT